MKPSSSRGTSLWQDRPEPIADEPLPQGAVVDDIVVGAGITGLTTALLLARAGRRVVVLDAGVVGSLASGHTTAKVSLLQGTKYSRMLRYQSKQVARAYVEGNLEGQQWMLRFCDDHGVPYQVRDAVTYASSPEQRSTLDDELQASRTVGLDTYAVRELDVPFPQFGGVVLPDQAQIDPMDLLSALVDQIRAHGGSVHQGHRVVGVTHRGRRVVRLEDGTSLDADHVVLATGTPILDRGLYFAKLEPMRSYALAFDAPDVVVPHGMYLSAGSPSRSVRDAPGGKLVIGGSGHSVGRTSSERAHVDELRAWTAVHFPGATETHTWSAQDYRSHDSVPYIGPMPRGGGRIYVATGFDKWGMAAGVMAGRSISAEILDQAPSWQKTMSRRVTGPSGAFHVASINAKVGAAAAVSAVSAELKPAPAEPAEGEGIVGRRGVVPVGVSTVDGTTCAVRAICTHLGGVLEWNDNERTWDCPLHASRFAPDGTVIEGPAVRPLTRLDESPAPTAQEQS
ncbi:FAD-dependent oxidoreductase [Aeromicrobium wangtongii]|uniref:FAD-dependent oxidoreductase n=1 Tax=Aeromicrobium wangtongii TaxID=2969247 RepID=A0ABY5M8W8_9ACTN|nr:FAD-dependent oxidoreductase [Aeromicrobium wangtongii]MCD9198742.1 FAD-dependent oxidoreductase [Aeromicrobium wangtongii]UUP13212.1 FAD-dependent oxidoreductase [Aeromicrobium wangtongii]